MSEWKKVKIGDICKIVKGTTGIASAEPGQYPLVVTAEERKLVQHISSIAKPYAFRL